MLLTEKETAFFNKNGFVGPFKIYTPEKAARLLKIIRIKNQDRSKILFDNSVNYDRHFDIEELAQHIFHAGICDRLNKILGPDILCWRTEFFPKFPHANGTEWHQVANYQYANGVPMLQPTLPMALSAPIDITVWTAFTDTTIETACMKFLPGSHLKRYYDESKPVDRKTGAVYESIRADSGFFGYDFSEFKIDPMWAPNESDAVSIPMKAGECIIFTAKCVHASHPNCSNNFTRFAIAARYVSTHVMVYPNLSRFYAHGAEFDLGHYGCVLVRGQNIYHHNKLRDTDNHDRPFNTVVHHAHL